jgi:tRNA-dihydrouridine synthase
MLEKTNCDAVMIGRGALGNPWVFQKFNALSQRMPRYSGSHAYAENGGYAAPY